jgi:dTDP-4-amino-4,6-dideoxygalactose transaminase
MQLDIEVLGVSRDRICDALNAEGVAVSRRYQNIHLLPIYQRKIAFGSRGFPWSSDICQREISYEKGICPVAERFNDSTYLGFGLCVYDLSLDDVAVIVEAFRKVWAQLNTLR